MCHNTYVATYSYNYIGLFPAPLALFVFVCRASPLVWSPPPVHFYITYLVGNKERSKGSGAVV